MCPRSAAGQGRYYYRTRSKHDYSIPSSCEFSESLRCMMFLVAVAAGAAVASLSPQAASVKVP